MLGVNYTTINNWIRAGRLNAFQTPGGHRRVMESDLYVFLEEYNLPIPAELTPGVNLMVLDEDEKFLAELDKWFNKVTAHRVDLCSNAHEALLMAGELGPSFIVISGELKSMEMSKLLELLGSRDKTRAIRPIVLLDECTDEKAKALKKEGVVACIDRTSAKRKLVEAIDNAVIANRSLRKPRRRRRKKAE